MNESQTKAILAVKLGGDEEYFALDEKRLREIQSQFASAFGGSPLAAHPNAAPSAEPPLVLAIGAPSVVGLDAHDDVPLLVAKRATGMRSFRVSEKLNLRLFATDLDTGATRSALLAVSHKRGNVPPPSASGSPPDAINAAAVRSGVTRYAALHAALGEAWKPGRYALTVAEYDALSNTVVVQLRAAENVAPKLPPPRAASPFLLQADQPPKLDAPGAALSVPEKGSAGAPILVQGSIVLPRNRAVLVPSSDPAHRPSHELLLATVVFLARDAEDPVQVDLAIPVKLSGQAGPEQMLSAGFSFLADAALAGAELSGVYAIYLLAGDVVAGPYSLDVARR